MGGQLGGAKPRPDWRGAGLACSLGPGSPSAPAVRSVRAPLPHPRTAEVAFSRRVLLPRPRFTPSKRAHSPTPAVEETVLAMQGPVWLRHPARPPSWHKLPIPAATQFPLAVKWWPIRVLTAMSLRFPRSGSRLLPTLQHLPSKRPHRAQPRPALTHFVLGSPHQVTEAQGSPIL